MPLPIRETRPLKSDDQAIVMGAAVIFNPTFVYISRRLLILGYVIGIVPTKSSLLFVT